MDSKTVDRRCFLAILGSISGACAGSPDSHDAGAKDAGPAVDSGAPEHDGGGMHLDGGGPEADAAVPPPVNPYVGKKFNWGDYMVTEAVLSGTFGSALSYMTEIDTLAAHGENIRGYVIMCTWAQLEDFTRTTNLNQNTAAGIDLQYPGIGSTPTNNIEAVANYLWSKIPTACLGLLVQPEIGSGTGIGGVSYITQNFSSNPEGAPVPAWIAQCGGKLTVADTFGGTATKYVNYPVAPIYSGASYYGFLFSQLITTSRGPDFFATTGAFHNPAVNQAKIQLYQAIASYKLKSGPFAGKTFDQCSQFEFIEANDEYSYDFTQNIAGVTVNPPLTNGPGGSSPECTRATWYESYRQWAIQTTAAWPHTSVGLCISFGVGADGTGDSDTPATLAGYVNNLLPPNNGLSAISGIALGDSDFEANEWGLNGWPNAQASGAYQGYLGIANPVSGSDSQINPVPAKSLVGKMRWIQQIQPYDYQAELPSGVAAASPAVVNAIIQGMAYAGITHRLWNCADQFNYGVGAWLGTSTNGANWGGQGVPAAINANPQKASSLLPLYDMYGPAIVSAAGASSTSIAIRWSAIVNQGTGLSIVLYRDGKQVATGSAASFTSHTDVGLSPGASHAYTLAMSNANGTGPQGTEVRATVT
jgi:hypothetical protein